MTWPTFVPLIENSGFFVIAGRYVPLDWYGQLDVVLYRYLICYKLTKHCIWPLWCRPLWKYWTYKVLANTLKPRQNGRHFAGDIFNCIFLNENVWIPIKISLKFVPKDPINNISSLVQIMAWCRPGDKPLSEPMMVSLPTHICVIRPQWDKCILSRAFLTLNQLSLCNIWGCLFSAYPFLLWWLWEYVYGILI